MKVEGEVEAVVCVGEGKMSMEDRGEEKVGSAWCEREGGVDGIVRTR